MTQPKPDTRNIYQRIHAVMGEVTYVQKQRNKGMQFSTVSHDAVTAKVRPSLHKHGVVYHPINMTHTQNGNRTEVNLEVRFVNIDDPSDFVDVPGVGYGVDNQDKGPGKAISYAVKYALLKALGLETGDDADHDSIDHEPGVEPQTITEAQYLELTAMLDQLGDGAASVEKRILHRYNILGLPKLPADKFALVKKGVEKELQKQEKTDAA